MVATFHLDCLGHRVKYGNPEAVNTKYYTIIFVNNTTLLQFWIYWIIFCFFQSFLSHVKLTSRLLHSTIDHVMWYFWVFTVNPFSLSCIFFSRKRCFLWFLCLWLIAELISLDTSGKPTVGFFLKITFQTWIIFPISLDKINPIDWFWKADNEFSWNFIFCFIVVKEFCYGKKY